MTRISRNPTVHGERYRAAEHAHIEASAALQVEAKREEDVWNLYQTLKSLTEIDDIDLIHDALELLDNELLTEIGNRFTAAADKVHSERAAASDNLFGDDDD